jgi:lipoate-protein ligase B
VPGERSTGYTGVWTGGRKIASIGVHARDWVTWHGFALNVSTDLSYFELIVPCGIPDVVMTSVARETGREDLVLGEVAEDAGRAFGEIFGLETRAVTVAELTRDAEVVIR